MEKTKVILHVGTHKTGSTAIQMWLRKNSSELLKNKFFFLEIDNSNLRDLMKVTDRNSKLIDQFRNFVDKKVKKGYVNIISSEYLSGDRDTLYENHELLTELLGNSFANKYDFTICCFLRRQDEFIQAMYTQAIQRGDNSAKNIEEYYNSLNNVDLCWTKYIDAYRIFFPGSKVNAIPYDRKVLKSFSVFELFEKGIDCKLPIEKEVIKTNVSYSPEALSLADDLNEYLSQRQKLTFRKCLQSISQKGIGNEYNILKPELKKLLYEKYREDNLILGEREQWNNSFGVKTFSEAILENDKEKNNLGLEKELILKLIDEYDSKLFSTKFYRAAVANKFRKLFR